MIDKDCIFAESFGDRQSLINKHGSGVIQGKPTVKNSPFGKVQRLDGANDFLSIPDADISQPTTKLTVICRVKILTLAVDDAFMAKWTYQTQASWAISTETTGSDEIRVHIADSLNDAGSNYAVSTGAGLTADGWRDVGFVYDGALAAADRVTIFVNGSAITTTATGTLPATLIDSTAPTNIGQFGGSLDRKMNADFACAWMYKRVLSDTEILNLATGKAF